MKLFGKELKFNGFDVWHNGNFDPSSKADSSHTHAKSQITDMPTKLGQFTNDSGFVTAANHSHSDITYKDTRSTNHGGFDYKGASMHLKLNTTDGLSDGGTYHGVLHLTQWGDISGGRAHQFGFTDNGNIWYRNWNGAWSSWIELAKISAIPTSLPADGGDSDTVDGKHASDFATAAQGTKADNALPASSYTSSDILTKLKTVDGSGSGLDADTVDGINSTGFARAYSAGYSFGGSQVAITTAEFITLLSSLGAFNQPYWVARGSWSYASNKYISDTGIGNIHLAGCTVEVIGNSSNYTIRIHTPTTSASGVINTEYVYVNNGSSYSPAWRKIWNDKNDGSGSGLDADLLDGKHASDFAVASHSHTKSQITDMPTKLSQFENDIGAGGGIKITTAATAPTETSPGDFWYKEI